MKRKSQIQAAVEYFPAGWASLSDLNTKLVELHAKRTTRQELIDLGIPHRVFFSATNKVKAVHIFENVASFNRGSWRTEAGSFGFFGWPE